MINQEKILTKINKKSHVMFMIFKSKKIHIRGKISWLFNFFQENMYKKETN